jgi:tripeptide aminopeptidase
MDKRTEDWFAQRLLRRLVRYARIDTASDSHSAQRPTTEGQGKLAKILQTELKSLGVERSILDENGFLIAAMEAKKGCAKVPVIGFMAHLDTSDDAPAKGVKPVVHTDYDGRPITLEGGLILDPKDFPELKRYRGQTIVTTDGRTLLGADDKAGIAEIMTAVEHLVKNPDIPHGRLEFIFTPDEETGFGMSRFPHKKVRSRFCYTLDGGGEGVFETECFEAYKVEVRFKGKTIHLGKARGKLVNAVEMAAAFINMLPKEESPQATDQRFGYYSALEIKGHLEEALVRVYIRDFEPSECLRRIRALKSMTRTLESLYPGGQVELEQTKQYSNMRRFLRRHPEAVNHLKRAIRQTGITPVQRFVRGGTDGARLSEMGVPTPNIFTGGYNYHSRLEWAAIPSMVKASQTVVNLARIWAENTK